MSKMSRTKGAAGELEVVHLLHDYGWIAARRTHDGREQAMRGDIANGPEGVHLEVKRVERLNLTAALNQAADDAPAASIPVVVHRSSRQPWLATLPLDELLPLLRLKEAG